MSDDTRLAQFLAYSAYVTAFSEFDLQGTGQAQAYLSTVEDVVGEDVVGELLAIYDRISSGAGGDAAATDDGLRRELFSDDRLGPVARNIIKLWYVGIWYELSPEWSEAFGARDGDATFVVSPSAYTEGLLWPAIGANPSGAKAPGYGTWAFAPRIAGWQPPVAAAAPNNGRRS